MQTNEDGRYADCQMTLLGHKYVGLSVGSHSTCHRFPGYNVAFDIGMATLGSTTAQRIFLTHGHNDHVGGLGSHYLRRDSWGLPPARYYGQEEDIEAVRELLVAQCRLNRSPALGYADLRAVKEGKPIPLESGREIIPFRSTHRIPCMGYAMWTARKRLLGEFQGVSKQELIEARSAGKQIDEVVKVPEIAFPGDTNLLILKRPAGEVVRTARVLLLECTFLDDVVSPEQAYKTGHVHIDAFVDAAKEGAFENELILLTHFSARYTIEEIRVKVAKKLEGVPIADRVKLLLPTE